MIKNASIIFWDFDGVIKDSVSVKSDAFVQLFLPFGEEISKRVKDHHEENGGMSRYDKLPIYLEWAGKENSKSLISEYEKLFSKLVLQRVIKSPWVLGAKEYIENNFQNQDFYIVTATPQYEIEIILSKLEIEKYFRGVIGSPISKKDALKIFLTNDSLNPKEAIMVGDSMSDYEAAKHNNIEFILRKTEFNKKLQKQLKCSIIEDFNYG